MRWGITGKAVTLRYYDMNITGNARLLREITISCHVCRGNTGNTICFQDMNVTGNVLWLKEVTLALPCVTWVELAKVFVSLLRK
jgi:hypothetical protein